MDSTQEYRTGTLSPTKSLVDRFCFVKMLISRRARAREVVFAADRPLPGCLSAPPAARRLGSRALDQPAGWGQRRRGSGRCLPPLYALAELICYINVCLVVNH